MERVQPIVLRNDETNEEYTLEFTRASIRFAESKGFVIDDVEKYPASKVEELFYYAFRAHHRNISREKTNKILYDDLGGLSAKFIERLGQLYAVPLEAIFNVDDEDGEPKPKNPNLSVEL